MIYVPEQFRPKHPFPYPVGNHTEFERWYYENYHLEPEDREYLPIFWTGYYCRNGFGKSQKAMDALQKYIDSLDRSKRYYTIVQYDNGIQNDLKDLDIMVFSMSGGRTDYALPLISCPHKYQHQVKNRSISANFIGRNTHPIRNCLLHAPVIGHVIGFREPDHPYFVTTDHHRPDTFCFYLSQSVFTLCPRGFGPTSFRIQEALQYGSIPVYISDEFIIPHDVDFNEYGVLIPADAVKHTHDILKSIPPSEIKRRQEAIPHIYNNYFTYEGNQNIIKKAVANEAVYIQPDY